MSEHDGLAEEFQTCRTQLHALAYRMLGSRSAADDAVQETWLRLIRVDAAEVRNLAGWLTAVLSRVCLGMLRSQASRREDPVGNQVPDLPRDPGRDGDPEQEAVLVDSVGRALLVVLDTLSPAERVAFVLHDMFAVPFDEIAPIVGRSPATSKKLASRARHRLRGSPVADSAGLARHRRVVEAFLAASRAGDLDAVLSVLAPDVVRRADPTALPPGRAAQVRGARAVSEEIVVFGSNARFAEPALIDGAVGAVVAPRGRLMLAITVTIEGEQITEYELIADPARLRRLDLAILSS